MAVSDDVKKQAKLQYRWFELPPEVRGTQTKEFIMLLDNHRWHEAEIMLEKLEKRS